MKRQNVIINGLNTEDYGVLSQGNPVITLPKVNYQRLIVPHRSVPQYKKETEKTVGSLDLTLNGVFKTITDRVNFEADVIHTISNQAISVIELESAKDIEYQCMLDSPVEMQEITNINFEQGEVIVTYKLNFTIEMYLKK